MGRHLSSKPVAEGVLIPAIPTLAEGLKGFMNHYISLFENVLCVHVCMSYVYIFTCTMCGV